MYLHVNDYDKYRISLEMKTFLQSGSEVQPGWQCAKDNKVISKKEEMFYSQLCDEYSGFQ